MHNASLLKALWGLEPDMSENYRPGNMIKSKTGGTWKSFGRGCKRDLVYTLSLSKHTPFICSSFLRLCTGVGGWTDNTGSTQCLLPWPGAWRVSEGANRKGGWDGGWSCEGLNEELTEVSMGGRLAIGSRWGRETKQLGHMADCQQAGDLVLSVCLFI